MTTKSDYKNNILDELVVKAKKFSDFSDEELSFIRGLLDKAFNAGDQVGWSEGYQESQNEINEKEV